MQVLINSPWVSLSVYRMPHLSLQSPRTMRWYYRIRLLSAEPVRQAYLRYITLVPDLRQTTIDYKDLAKETAQSLYEKSLRTYPDDTRLSGKVITAKFDLRKLKLNGRLEI